MRVHYRNRRPAYGSSRQDPQSGLVTRRIIAGVILLVIVYVGYKGITGVFSFFGGHEEAATLLVEPSSNVDVSYEGKDFQAAETNTKLQPGDSVKTTADSHAVLTFFDGTRLRLDGATSVTLKESRASRNSSLTLQVTDGDVFVVTPQKSAFSGSIVRRIETPEFSYVLPPHTEALLGARSIAVYNADGDGVSVERKNASAITASEGQQLVVPETVAADGDISSYRTAFTLSSLRNAFVSQTRQMLSGVPASAVAEQTDILNIQSPADGAMISDTSVRVQGRVDATVQHVQVNGSEAVIDPQNETFAKDIPVTQGEDTVLHIVALDANGKLLAEATRTVKYGTQTSSSATATGVPGPEITSPAKTGDTYQTNDVEVVLRGTVPADTQRVFVNDYELKLYTPGKGTWSYLARLDLGNLKAGENTFDVTGINTAGTKTGPARLTILQGKQPIAGTTSSSAASVAPPKNNAPLTPGILSVTGPEAGNSYTATGTGFLLEGKTSATTASMWVNDYRLQLYTAGKTYWNYIASSEYANLKPGTNTYHIVARNADGEVLDTFDYTVTYQAQ